ncbi:dipicolinate synthase subunit A [Alteribacillus persepolensis]|uniref:Dipicolinate synthase subunit A n=1 Tax=Alteribacillus persepolensis TaxID=568899 RepID=A0A1G7YUP5_9BACI|nr:dipicolinate synthase subunit DpsA [Alteribacillus persepolensis]SDG99590.1 dipicolinate synthase subunit A [Alteribacillus persepolensis]
MGKPNKLAFIGGDARQIEMAEYLWAQGDEIYLFGFDQWMRNTAGITKAKSDQEIPWDQLHAVILPVSGLKANQKVEACFSSKDVILNEKWLKQTPESCVIISGISTQELEDLLQKVKRKTIKLLERDDVAIYNSIPSAEGTLLMAMQETDITIHKSNTIILGFGRTGQTIARTFSVLGAYAKVGTIHPAEKARAEAMGLETFEWKNLQNEVQSADLCINTVPASVLTEDILVHFPVRSVIIDIASPPGGTDFSFAKQRGIKAILAPGLPGAVAPKTAGQILAKVISQLLGTNQVEKEA